MGTVSLVVDDGVLGEEGIATAGNANGAPLQFSAAVVESVKRILSAHNVRHSTVEIEVASSDPHGDGCDGVFIRVAGVPEMNGDGGGGWGLDRASQKFEECVRTHAHEVHSRENRGHGRNQRGHSHDHGHCGGHGHSHDHSPEELGDFVGQSLALV